VLLDLLSGITLAEVNGDAADLLRLLETLGNTVDNVHLRGAAEDGRVRGHETDGASPKHGDRLSRLEARELDTMPALRI
jgi:hypothetical protein